MSGASLRGTLLMIRDRARRRLAAAVRRLPGSRRLLGIPVKRIPSASAWVDNYNKQLDWWERGKGAHYSLVYGKQAVIRHVPRASPRCEVHPVLIAERFHVHQEAFVVRVPRGSVVGPNGLVLSEDGELFEESAWGAGWLEFDPVMLSLRLRAERFDGDAYVLGGFSSEGYAHWLLEVLPKVLGLSLVPRETTTIVVPGPLSAFQSESLALLGVDTDSCLALRTNPMRFDSVFFPSFFGSPGNIHPAASRELSQALLRAVGVEPAPRKRFFITRRDMAWRRIVNEAAVFDLLSQYGFEEVDPGRLSFAQQVELFSQAEAIVGGHGSGLANVLFAPEGCHVLELRDPIHKDCNFFALADAKNHQYWFLVAERKGGLALEHPAPWTMPRTVTKALDDLTVPIGELDELLRAMLR